MLRSERSEIFKNLSPETFDRLADTQFAVSKSGKRLTPRQMYQKIYQQCVVNENPGMLKKVVSEDCKQKLDYIVKHGDSKQLLGTVLSISLGLPKLITDEIKSIGDLFDAVDKLGLIVMVVWQANGYSATIMDRNNDNRTLMQMHEVTNVKILTNTIIQTVVEWITKNTSQVSKVFAASLWD